MTEKNPFNFQCYADNWPTLIYLHFETLENIPLILNNDFIRNILIIVVFLLTKKNRNTHRGSASCFNCIVQSIRPTYKAITFHYIVGTRHTREKTSSDDLTIQANNQSIGKTNVIYGVIINGTSTPIFIVEFVKKIVRNTCYMKHNIINLFTHSLISYYYNCLYICKVEKNHVKFVIILAKLERLWIYSKQLNRVSYDLSSTRFMEKMYWIKICMLQMKYYLYVHYFDAIC